MNMEPRKFREDQVFFGLWFGFFGGGGQLWPAGCHLRITVIFISLFLTVNPFIKLSHLKCHLIFFFCSHQNYI